MNANLWVRCPNTPGSAGGLTMVEGSSCCDQCSELACSDELLAGVWKRLQELEMPLATALFSVLGALGMYAGVASVATAWYSVATLRTTVYGRRSAAGARQ